MHTRAQMRVYNSSSTLRASLHSVRRNRAAAFNMKRRNNRREPAVMRRMAFYIPDRARRGRSGRACAPRWLEEPCWVRPEFRPRRIPGSARRWRLGCSDSVTDKGFIFYNARWTCEREYLVDVSLKTETTYYRCVVQRIYLKRTSWCKPYDLGAMRDPPRARYTENFSLGASVECDKAKWKMISFEAAKQIERDKEREKR